MANHIFIEEADGWYCVCCSLKVHFPKAINLFDGFHGFENAVPKICYASGNPDGIACYEFTSLQDANQKVYQYLYPPAAECPVLTKYEKTVSMLQRLPLSIKNDKAWDEANRDVRQALEALLVLDEDLPDGLQATMRRFLGTRALKSR